MVTVEDFSRLVSGIYAAAVTPQHWEAALRDIQRTLEGTGGALLMAEGATWSIENSTLPAGAVKSYAEYYHRLDHVVSAVQHGPVGPVRTGRELMPLVRKSEFYEGWLLPLAIDDVLIARLTGGPRPTCFIAAAPRRSESFDTPERVKLVSSLVPHLQQALRMQGNLAALAEGNADLVGALDAVRHGVVIVGSAGCVINLNAAAERILRAEDGVQICAGRLAATGMHMEQKLHGAIHLAVLDDASNIRGGRSFTCERPSGKRAYVIHVLPVHRVAADAISGETALVLIVDPEHEPEPAAALLRRVHGLTRTEADVALHILRGADVRQIADELSISVATVRTHLQHVFDKTDTHRQAELVRHLLRLAP
jgi:DNA-binding CsgD family transcriptional regulator/PAS domain-containing protein